MIGDEPVQRVHHPGDIEFNIEYYDVGAGPHPSLDPAGEVAGRFVRPFDLSQAPLLRVGLIPLEENEHMLLLDMHHIICDGLSMTILIKDFTALFAGQPGRPLRLQYKDFCQFQHTLLITGQLREQEQYWLERFSGEIPSLNMPTDYPRSGYPGHEAGLIRFRFDGEQTRRLKTLMKETGTTLFMVLLAVYNVLLSKYTRQEDIVIGLPVAGRNYPGLQDIAGLMIETLAIRNYPEAGKTFSGFLAEVKKNTLEAFENQSYPFRELIEKVAPKSYLSRNPLFDAMLNVWNFEFDIPEIAGGDLQIEPYEAELPHSAKVEISLEVSELEDKIFFRLYYCETLYKRETMERFVQLFQDVTSMAVADPGIKLGNIALTNDLEEADANLYIDEDSEFAF